MARVFEAPPLMSVCEYIQARVQAGSMAVLRLTRDLAADPEAAPIHGKPSDCYIVIREGIREDH